MTALGSRLLPLLECSSRLWETTLCSTPSRSLVPFCLPCWFHLLPLISRMACPGPVRRHQCAHSLTLKEPDAICMLTTPKRICPAQNFPVSEQIRVPAQHVPVNIRCFKANIKTELLRLAPKCASLLVSYLRELVTPLFQLPVLKPLVPFLTCCSLTPLSGNSPFPDLQNLSTFNIYPESDHFSPLSLLPSWSKPSRSLDWVVVTASSLVSPPLPLPPRDPFSAQQPFKSVSQMMSLPKALQ